MSSAVQKCMKKLHKFFSVMKTLNSIFSYRYKQHKAPLNFSLLKNQQSNLSLSPCTHAQPKHNFYLLFEYVSLLCTPQINSITLLSFVSNLFYFALVLDDAMVQLILCWLWTWHRLETFGKKDLSWENAPTSLACGKAYGVLINDRCGWPVPQAVVPPLGEWFWIV